MKVVAFNGSPRKNGNTSLGLRHVQESLEKNDIQFEEVRVGGKTIRGCLACGKCRVVGHCIQKDDGVNDWAEMMKSADGIILASPTYFASCTMEMKGLIDRVGYLLYPSGVLNRKVGAPVVVARRGGAIQTYNVLMAFFGINNMVVPMSSYWNMLYGMNPGDVENDAEGIGTMKTLGENMAWVMKKIDS